MLAREPGTGAGHSALDLVRDEYDAVGGAPFLQRHEVALRGHDEPAFALNGLDDQTGEIGRTDLLLEVGDGASGSIRSREPVMKWVGVGGVMHVGGEWSEPELVGHRFERHRHREVRASVISVVEHPDARAAGVLACDLDRVLDGFGARVDEHRLFGEVTRGVLREQFGDANVSLVGRDCEHRVGELGELGGCRRDHGRVRVSDCHHADAGAEVDELVAVDVDDNRPVRALDEHGESRPHPDGNRGHSTRLESHRLWTGYRGDDAALLLDRAG